MLNLAPINAVPINSSFSSEILSYGDAFLVRFVADGEAESGPFVVVGDATAKMFVFAGEAVTPTVLIGDVVAPEYISQGAAVTQGWGRIQASQRLAVSTGDAAASTFCIGACLHRFSIVSGSIASGAFIYGETEAIASTSSGIAFTADISTSIVSYHPAFICRGLAGSSVSSDEYLDFERDQIVAPTVDSSAFTILQFERQ